MTSSHPGFGLLITGIFSSLRFCVSVGPFGRYTSPSVSRLTKDSIGNLVVDIDITESYMSVRSSMSLESYKSDTRVKGGWRMNKGMKERTPVQR